MWIPLQQSVFTHRKTVAVAETLEMEEVYVVGHLAALWGWALDNADDDGVIRASARTIEKASYWQGERGALVYALLAAGYLRECADGYGIHDWEDHLGKLLNRRKNDAARQKAHRERHKNTDRRDVTHPETDPSADVTRDITVTSALRNGVTEHNSIDNPPTPLRDEFVAGEPPPPKPSEVRDEKARALFTAYRSVRHPKAPATIPATEWRMHRSAFRTMADDGVTPDQVAAVTRAAMSRFERSEMVTVPSICRNWADLVERAAPPPAAVATRRDLQPAPPNLRPYPKPTTTRQEVTN